MDAKRVGLSAVGAIGAFYGAKHLAKMVPDVPAKMVPFIPIVAGIAGFAIVYHVYGDPTPSVQVTFANASGAMGNSSTITRPGMPQQKAAQSKTPTADFLNDMLGQIRHFFHR